MNEQNSVSIKWQDTLLIGFSEEFLSPIDPKIGDILNIIVKVYKINRINNRFFRIAPNGELFNILTKKTKTTEFYAAYEAELKIFTKILSL